MIDTSISWFLGSGIGLQICLGFIFISVTYLISITILYDEIIQAILMNESTTVLAKGVLLLLISPFVLVSLHWFITFLVFRILISIIYSRLFIKPTKSSENVYRLRDSDEWDTVAD